MIRRGRLAAVAVLALLAGALAACTDDATGPLVIRLRFVTQPAAAVAGAAQGVQVELLGASGERLSAARDEVTLTLAGSTAEESVWRIRAVAGLASFDDVRIAAVAESHVLTATARGLSVASLPFSVAPAGASAEHSTFAVASTNPVSNTPYEVVFTFRDAFGNGVAGAPLSLSATGATFTPASGVTSADGAFTSLVRASAGALVVTATVNGVAITLTPAVSVADACTVTAAPVPGTFSGQLLQGAGCLIQNRPVHVRSFSTTDLSGVTADVRPEFNAFYEIRSSPDRPSIEFVTDDSSAVEWYLPAGTYEFRVGAASGSGPYTVKTTTGPGNTGEGAKVLVAAGTFPGQALSATDLFDGIWYNDLFLFADPRPCTITLRSTAFNAYLLLFNALTGGQIAAQDDGGGGTDAQITRASCLSVGNSPILINATSLLNGETGPYTLIITINEPPPGAAVRAGAEAAPIRIAMPSDLRRFLRGR